MIESPTKNPWQRLPRHFLSFFARYISMWTLDSLLLSYSDTFSREQLMMMVMMMMMMLMMMMMMINCFCGMGGRWKEFSVISSGSYCQISTPSRISNTPRAGFEPTQDPSLGFVKWSCAVVITATPRSQMKSITSNTVYYSVSI